MLVYKVRHKPSKTYIGYITTSEVIKCYLSDLGILYNKEESESQIKTLNYFDEIYLNHAEIDNKPEDFEIVKFYLIEIEDDEFENGEQVMPKIDGKSFRCDVCGANVFTKSNKDELKYKCNGCQTLWRGEK
jgi:hypothetical protein